jgi:hypothetical protein
VLRSEVHQASSDHIHAPVSELGVVEPTGAEIAVCWLAVSVRPPPSRVNRIGA